MLKPFSKVFKRAFGKKLDREMLPFAPEGIIYTIGDIHGRFDLLERMLKQIEEDAVQSEINEDDITVVFLGDYVDRGDHSAQVIDCLIGLKQMDTVSIRFLKGNHETMMLDFLDDPENNSAWLRYGGLATLLSYGVRGLTQTADSATRLRAARELSDALGSQKRAFLDQELHLTFQSGNVFMCHAAIDPDLPLEDQGESDLLWGNEDFMQKGGPPDTWIVHGHTIKSEPDFGHNRLGIDTGAYYSGRLTTARISSGKVKFLTT